MFRFPPIAQIDCSEVANPVSKPTSQQHCWIGFHIVHLAEKESLYNPHYSGGTNRKKDWLKEDLHM